MAAIGKSGRRSGLLGGWQRAGRMMRMLVGLVIVVAASALQQSQLVVSGPDFPWPNVALWAAAGWGLSGLAIRPMIILIILGLAQDVLLNAPIGAFVLVNLSAFGAAAILAGRSDRDVNDASGLLFGLIAIIIGFVVTVILAVSTNDASPRLLPVIGDLGVTLLLFMVVYPLFTLPTADENMFRGR